MDERGDMEVKYQVMVEDVQLMLEQMEKVYLNEIRGERGERGEG